MSHSELPITDVLRKAVVDSGLSFAALERETGVLRQTLMPFARGEAGLNITAADKLALYFGLELRPAAKRKGK
ncbi:hypothetical protein [Planctellipticum variicoloris]|uniref:hypothetical protein n=1 Tax=Planctellipticum variicoloris TaxID=3064265 RepID=UPI003013731B|nr:hypothetical protein SH412_003265 [Planctomycetaceae bacterium SH412]